MDYYEDNKTKKQAQDIVYRDKAKKIASASFNNGAKEGHAAGILAGQKDALSKMQRLANMKDAFERVQRTPRGLPIDPDDASLASDFVSLQRANEVGSQGLGGNIMNADAQDYMLNRNSQAGSVEQNNTRKAPVIIKTRPTATTLRAMQIAKDALQIGN